MSSIGKIYNHEWSFPVRALSLQLYIQRGNDNEIWYIRYSTNRSLWKIDNKLIKVQNFQITFGLARFFLYLPPVSDEYLYEIERIAQVILDAKDMYVTTEVLYKKLRKTYDKSELKPKKHYSTMLSFSKCFIEISISDTFGKELVVWRVHKDNLETFKAIKKMVQNIYIDTTGTGETVKLFYTPKPKKPKRPDPPTKVIEKVPISNFIFNRNKPSMDMPVFGTKPKKGRKRAASI